MVKGLRRHSKAIAVAIAMMLTVNGVSNGLMTTVAYAAEESAETGNDSGNEDAGSDSGNEDAGSDNGDSGNEDAGSDNIDSGNGDAGSDSSDNENEDAGSDSAEAGDNESSNADKKDNDDTENSVDKENQADVVDADANQDDVNKNQEMEVKDNAAIEEVNTEIATMDLTEAELVGELNQMDAVSPTISDVLTTGGVDVGIAEANKVTSEQTAVKVEAEALPETDNEGRKLYATGVEGVSFYLDTDFDKEQNLDYTFNKYGYITGVNINFVVNKEMSGDVQLPVSEAAFAAMQLYATAPGNGMPSYPTVPGDTFAFTFNVTLQDGSKHTYQYKDGSFLLTPPDMTDVENKTGATSFDGQDIPYDYVGALAKSEPIQELLGVTNSSKVTIDKIMTIYEKLQEKGFEGEHALTDYMLSYYNNKYGTEYAEFSKLANDMPSAVINMQGGMASAQYSVTASALENLKNTYAEQFEKGYIKEIQNANGSYTLQLKWPEKELQTASFDTFYKDLFVFTFGEDYTYAEFSKYVNSSAGTTLGIGDYMEENSEQWAKANEYFNQLSALGYNKESAAEIAFSLMMGINGPYTNNAYQLYDYGFNSSVTLEQVDGGISIDKVDENGDKITAADAGFNLYYISSENDQNVTYYYSLDEAGNVSFTTDKNQAAILVTENGNINVQYLLPNTYYLAEIIAPDGYTLNTDIIEVLVSKGEITEVQVVNSLIPSPDPDPEPEPDPEPDPTPDPAPNPDPTPNPTPTPLTPPTTGGAGNNGGNGGNSSDGGSTSTGTTTTTTTINDQATPLASAPVVDELTTLDDEAVPLATFVIEEEEVPLAQLPKTGDTRSAFPILAAILSGMLLGLGFMFGKKRDEQ